jgi:hypothetical protein
MTTHAHTSADSVEPFQPTQSRAREETRLTQQGYSSHQLHLSSPKFLQILSPPLRTPSRLLLNLLQQLQNRLLLTLMTHPLACDPQRLYRIRPRSMIIVANRYPADLARVPEDGVGLGCDDNA